MATANRHTVARPYARAAFERAYEGDTVAAWNELLRLLDLLVSDALMRSAIRDPRLGEERLVQLVRDVCGERIADEAQGKFVDLLIRSGRLEYAPEIRRQFEERRARAEETRKVQLTSAFPMQPKERDKLSKLLARHLQSKVEVTVRTDSALIGGVHVRIGDQVIDASLRGRLDELAAALG